MSFRGTRLHYSGKYSSRRIESASRLALILLLLAAGVLGGLYLLKMFLTGPPGVN